MQVLFLHGLEGSPQGKKAQWPLANYDTRVPSLDTTQAQNFLSSPRDQDFSLDKPAHIFEAPVKAALSALTAQTSIIIGSSFGGAVLGQLVEKGHWEGPCIFLASAHVKFDTLSSFVGRSICIHGTADTIVPSSPVAAFVAQCGPPHEFWGIEDNHSLSSIRESGVLANAITQLTTSTEGNAR